MNDSHLGAELLHGLDARVDISNNPDEVMIDLPTKPDALLAWMDALADPTRLRLMRLLERHELGVAELCVVLQMPQSTVSRHLKSLSENNLTQSRRRGTTNLYRTILDEVDPAARKLWRLACEEVADWATFKQDNLRLKELLAKRRTDADTFFTGAADEWARLREELYGPTFTTHALLSLLPGHYVVADIGCGTGQVSLTLAGHVRQVIAVDNNVAMLEAARSRAAGHENIDVRQGDADALPIDDAVCDAAMLMLVLTYLQEPADAIRELSRIIKPGGKAVIVDLLNHDRDDFRRQFGQHCLGFRPDRLSSLLTDAGFDAPRVQPIPPFKEARGPALLLATATKSH